MKRGRLETKGGEQSHPEKTVPDEASSCEPVPHLNEARGSRARASKKIVKGSPARYSVRNVTGAKVFGHRYLEPMDLENMRSRSDETASLEGHFLIAMPGMEDERFARSVIYVCAHSSNGAMGFVINKGQPLSFASLLTQLDIVKDPDEIRLPDKGREVSVCLGGPVERGRGFVLHSDDYDSESTVTVDEGISLTPTLDILKAISKGIGPTTAIMALGYAGWGAGQLESEIAANGWLTCPAKLDIVFDPALDDKYARALGILGVDPVFLTSEAGHA